ncbi:uncharacterized protein LOC120147057 [Hibiscus syriacus]|uniref:uncharacterized protein LOC120147057 n=1 Tax=Hibiscus syriacus TaxID=106335 RepID=UPI00192349DF|nr:uncharacterized protein LOC120147057 [Hibiscus syriacus]
MNTCYTLLIIMIMIIQIIVIVIFVKEKEIQAFGIIIVRSVILLLIPIAFLEIVHLSRTGPPCGIMADMIMSLVFSGRLRVILNVPIAVSFAKKKFSSVLSLHATTLPTTDAAGLEKKTFEPVTCMKILNNPRSSQGV